MRRFNAFVVPTKQFTSSSASISKNLCLSHVAFTQLRHLTSAERDDLSRVVSSIQSEAKGQSVDLSDMADATRNALKQIQDASKQVNFGEPRMKAKVQTLQTALKAYSGRLNNIQNEAKSLHADAEKVLKLIYGNNDNSRAATSAASSSSSSSTTKVTEAEVEEDFNVEPPMTAQKLEQMNSMPPGSTFAGDASSQAAKPSSTSVSEDEIVIETVEVEEESANNNDVGAGMDNMNQIKADETSISEITSILHEKGIDFSECRDAKSLRQRYKDFLDGKYDKKPEAAHPNMRFQSEQPQTPSNSYNNNNNSSYNSGYSQQYQNQTYQQQPPSQPHPSYQQQTPNTTETGLQADPHPGAIRKQIDTQRFVRDVKEEIARENGVQASQIDIWSGMTKLEDHKRLYEYPNLQSNPLEVRQKGDMPRR